MLEKENGDTDQIRSFSYFEYIFDGQWCDRINIYVHHCVNGVNMNACKKYLK